MTSYEYLALRYKQSSNSEIDILTFVCTNGDIASWAGVPRKAEGIQKKGTITGFQRELQNGRVQSISHFFKNDKNISPTAIVVAFREGFVEIEEINETKIGIKNKIGRNYSVCKIKIKHHDLSKLTLSQLISEVIDNFSQRIQNNAIVDVEEDESIVDAEEDESIVDAEEDESIVDAEEDESILNAENIDIFDDFILYDSHLRNFVDQLINIKTVLDSNEKLPEDINIDDLRDMCSSLLKPAMLVDGQHRVFGSLGKDEIIPFTVCGIKDASWEEQVFQFVILNQKSEGIAKPFLSSIISTSLTQSEMNELNQRLSNSGIDTEIIEVMAKLNNSQGSPFYKMIKFGVVGELGMLPYLGLSRLAKSFKKMYPSKFRIILGNTISVEDWLQSETEEFGVWYDYFVAFWNFIKKKYEMTPENELPLWDLNINPDSQLLKIATMVTIQKMFITWIQTSRRKIETLENFVEMIDLWLVNVTRDFFAEKWKGVDRLSIDGKKTLEKVMSQLLTDSAFRFRSSTLFQKKQ